MLKKNRPIDCKEFISLIPNWLNEELGMKQANRFLEHMDTCVDCKEELHIQYLVKEGMVRLESGASFNLDQELKNKIQSYQNKLERKRRMDLVVYWMEAVSIAAMIFMLALVFVMH